MTYDCIECGYPCKKMNDHQTGTVYLKCTHCGSIDEMDTVEERLNF